MRSLLQLCFDKCSGDGFYFAFSRRTGIDYANQADRPALVSAKVRVCKPNKFADSIDFESFLSDASRVEISTLSQSWANRIREMAGVFV